jgi:hypothetical protein
MSLPITPPQGNFSFSRDEEMISLLDRPQGVAPQARSSWEQKNKNSLRGSPQGVRAC